MAVYLVENQSNFIFLLNFELWDIAWSINIMLKYSGTRVLLKDKKHEAKRGKADRITKLVALGL